MTPDRDQPMIGLSDRRTVAALLGIAFAASLAPACVLECPHHGDVRGAAPHHAGSHGAEVTHHAGRANAPSHPGEPQDDSGHCTCPGSCATVGPASPVAGAGSERVHAPTAAAPRPDAGAVRARHHLRPYLLPFSTAPPPVPSA
jgi:hypothetical protein